MVMLSEEAATMHTTTLELPLPRLSEGRFSSCSAFTDEALFEAIGVRIAFLERVGGVSEPPYDSLNLGEHVGDSPDAVARNAAIALDALGARGASCIRPLQVHGTQVGVCLSADEAQACARCAAQGMDGVVVACCDVAAMLCFADCVPVILVSPSGAFSVVHAGWRGVAGRIVEEAVRKLSEADGMPPSSFNAYIGAYIHACHFEVVPKGGEGRVASGEPSLRDVFAEGFGEGCLRGSRHVDLGAALRVSLARCGIESNRVADADVCTVCDGGERFFSYRATDGSCGRHGALAVRMGK